MACSSSFAGTARPGPEAPAAGGDHLGRQAQRVGHLAVGAADDLGQVVGGDRVARRAADEFLDARLGVGAPCAACATNWTGSVIFQTAQTVTSTFLPSAVGTSTSFSDCVVPCQTWRVLGSLQHFLDEGELEVEPWLGAAGDRLAELQEHGELALADRVADGLAQGDEQDQEQPDQDGDAIGDGSFAASLPSNPGSSSGRNCLRSASMIVLSFTVWSRSCMASR